MKKQNVIHAVLFFGSICVSWASLSPEQEGALAACHYVDRRESPFAFARRSPLISSSDEALASDWKAVPSEQLEIEKLRQNPTMFSYRSGFCEQVFQQAIYDLTGDQGLIRSRCLALEQDPTYKSEKQNRKNTYLVGKKPAAITDAERHWCGDEHRRDTEYIEIACNALKASRDMISPTSPAYTEMFDALKNRCGDVVASARQNPYHSKSQMPLTAGGGNELSPGLQSDYSKDGPPVFRPPAQPTAPCAQQQLRVLNITPPGGALYTLANAAIAGIGIWANYEGQKHADDLRYKLTNYSQRAMVHAGLVPGLNMGGGYWGQGGFFPGMPGAPFPVGACGVPPFHTGYTGCSGGMPGMPPPGMFRPPCNGGGYSPTGFGGGGGCGGGMWGYPYRSPCSMGGGPSGNPFGNPYGGGGPFGNGGGGAFGRPPFTGPGLPGGMPYGGPFGSPGGCGGASPWGMGSMGPYGMNPYMNNPAMMGAPNGMNSPFNPYALDAERARLQAMQAQLAQQNAAIARMASYSNQLSNLDRERQTILNNLNTARMGYPG